MSIKVISLNMWSGGRLWPALLEFLTREKADIVLLQEVYDSQDMTVAANYRSMTELRKALAYPYDDFAEAYCEDRDGRLLPHGNAVLSMFPIEQRVKHLLTKADLPAYRDIPEHWPILPALLQEVSVAVAGQSVNIFNLHGVWDLDGDNYSPRRQQMSRGILEAVGDKPRVVLAGDTNAKSTNQAMRDLEVKLNSVFGSDIPTTFNMRRKDNPGYASAAVDLMFVSPDWRVVEKAVPDVDVSDHLPLVVTLDMA